MFPANLTRWIFASVTKHFYDRRGGYEMWIEGQRRRGGEDANQIEVRMDGPDLTEVSKDYWRVFIEVNILCSAVLDDQSFHTLHQMVGDISSKFTNIGVFRLGVDTDPSNDGTLIGCLELVQHPSPSRGRLRIRHFGQVNPEIALIRASVEGHYQAFFTFS